MRTVLVRLLLVAASSPAYDAAAEVLVLDSPMTERGLDLERRLAMEFGGGAEPAAANGLDPANALVVNMRIGADGRLDIVNAHGGNAMFRAAVLERLRGMDLA